MGPRPASRDGGGSTRSASSAYDRRRPPVPREERLRMATIETVSGPVDEEDLGLTLAHEHIRSTSEGVRANFPHLYDEQDELDKAVAQFKEVMDRGVKTIVEPTCMDLGRDVHLARRVVEATGIQLVMCTGIYGARYTFLPQHFA